MKFSALPVALICITLLSACGSGSGSSSSSSAEDYNPDRYLGGNCGSNVVSDYNKIVIRCKNMTTDAEARNCKSTAQSFLNKYPGASCQAEESSSSSVNKTPVTLTAAKVQKIVDDLTALGY